jgi:lipoprotein NlpI
MAYFARGLCFKSLGDNKKARFDFIKTLELDPTFKEAEIELKEVKK